MKISHLLFLLAFGLFTSCSDDETTTPNSTILSYDHENLTGPLLDAGEHELAVRFPASMMAEHVGKKLTEVQVFIGNLPSDCSIKIYGKGDASNPGQKLYEGNVINAANSGVWNYFKIAPGIDINGEDLWIGVNVVHTVKMQSIGCDSGPAKTDADWLFSGLDISWKTYRDRTGESVNWNIRGKVE